MSETADRPFGWVAALTYVCGAAVVVPSLIALAIAILAVAVRLV